MRCHRRAVANVFTSFALLMAAAVSAQQGQPQIGIAPVALGDQPYTFDTAEQHRIRVVVVARGLVHPFSLAFLPNGDALVTERGTRLRLVRNATGQLQSGEAQRPRLDPDPLAGLPPMPAFRGGGLQEIALHPKFAANRLVYFTYNKAGEARRQPGTAAKRGHAGARTIRRQGAHRGRGSVRRRLEYRRQRIADRVRAGRSDLHDHRRAVQRSGAAAEHRVRQGVATAGRRQGTRRQSVRRTAGIAARDLLARSPRSAGNHDPSVHRHGA